MIQTEYHDLATIASWYSTAHHIIHDTIIGMHLLYIKIYVTYRLGFPIMNNRPRNGTLCSNGILHICMGNSIVYLYIHMNFFVS